ncbi:MAG: hypothetical protein NVV73_04175, partial [Cellvibrionaceae bacterium]|nr:hypothetical protein [Cellvibrionaceae bacterium]
IFISGKKRGEHQQQYRLVHGDRPARPPVARQLAAASISTTKRPTVAISNTTPAIHKASIVTSSGP